MSSRYYIPILEFDITNRCNLNCARCSHFSPLASFNCMDYSLEQFTNDVQEIKKKFVVKTFHIVGGEPFIVPNLLDYIRVLREAFDYSIIEIITNGTLKDRINGMAEDLRIYKVKLTISDYPHYTQADKLIIGKTTNRQKFRSIALSLNSEYDSKKSKTKCAAKDCLSVYNGRIYYCPIMKNLVALEKAFDINFNLSLEDRSVNLYNNTAEEIFLALYNEDKWGKLCSHCPSTWPEYHWELSKKELSEWVNLKDKK